MAGDEPEKGDKVSWNWGGGAPGGEVVEKKTEGEVAITSKRGNKIKKNAEPDNPAIHIARSGNDVVKKASEVNVEKKGKGGGEKKDDESNKKRKSDEEKDGAKAEGDGLEKNEEGKDVRKGGKKETPAAKKRKAEEKEEKEEEEEEKKAEEKKDEKKGRGRPKSDGNKNGTKDKKAKKEPAVRQDGDMVSTRTRSQGKK